MNDPYILALENLYEHIRDVYIGYSVTDILDIQYVLHQTAIDDGTGCDLIYLLVPVPWQGGVVYCLIWAAVYTNKSVFMFARYYALLFFHLYWDEQKLHGLLSVVQVLENLISWPV